MSRIRVAVDARLYRGTSTGDSTYWTCLIDQLGSSNDEFEFLYYSNVPAAQEIPGGMRIVPGVSRWWSLVRFPLAARRAGAQIVHTQYSLSPLVRRGGVTTIHDVSFFVEPGWFSKRDRTLLRLTVPAAARRAERILTVSETSKQEIERFIPASKGKLVVSLLACPPWIKALDRGDAKRSVEAKFGISGDFALTAATRWARKNTDLAVDAVSAVQGRLDLALVLVGKSQSASVPSASWIHRLGYVSNEDLNELYAAAAAYLLPSLHEGFGLPIVEAWRCGAPVFAMSRGAVPEVAGDAASLIDDPTPTAWSERLVAEFGRAGRLQELRDLGRERLKRYSWAQTAVATLDAYRGAQH